MEGTSNLFNWIFGPIGLVLIIVSTIGLRMLFKKSNYIFYLLALMALFASFGTFVDPFGRETPKLVFPLEMFRQNGRIFTLGFLLLIVFYAFNKKVVRFFTQPKDFFFIKTSLLIIQGLIFFKNLMYGSITTALLVFCVFLLVYLIFYKGFPYWLSNEKCFKTSIFAFLLAIVLFNAMGFYQSLIDPFAMSFIQDRFFGMTENPQHAAVLLTSGIPVFLVSIIDVTKLWKKTLLIIGLFWTFYYLTLTGSRTGMIMAVVSLLLFFSGFKTKAIKWFIVGSILTFSIITITDYNPFRGNESVIERYSSTENTREEVVEIQLRKFRTNLLFGAPPRGERVGFAENSYLAVAASLGIIGLIPLVFMLRGILKMLVKLWSRAKYSMNKHYYYLVISGLISLLVGAVAEAYLLGNITWPIILLFCYVHWGYYLLQNDKKIIPDA